MIRRLQLLAIAAVVIVAAFSTGLPFLFYLVYLGVLVVGGSYVLTRLALVNLEAGYAVSQLYGHVGDQLRVTYTLRNTGFLPKPWLEVHNPTTLPGGLAGRAIALGSRGERSWQVRVPLSRRGAFRIDALDVRSGDPFGFFEASASVGQGVSLIVYPRVDPLPHWKLPTAMVEGSHAQPERTLQTTPLATTVRPWAPGDSFNRIHWRTTARHGEIQVKEFDLEQTADAWIFLDLEGRVQAGEGDESTVEVGVRAAASIADRALVENRAVGLTTTGLRNGLLPADRGSRQHMKVMQLLAAVEGDGVTTLAEALVQGLPRLRRGMTAVVITSSTDRDWVKPLASLRPRGVACVVVTLDGPSFAGSAAGSEAGGAAQAGWAHTGAARTAAGDATGAVDAARTTAASSSWLSGGGRTAGATSQGGRAAAAERTGRSGRAGGSGGSGGSSEIRDSVAVATAVTASAAETRPISRRASGPSDAQQVRALRHALAEYDLRTYTVRAGSRLAEVLSR